MQLILEDERRIRFVVGGEGFDIVSDGVSLSPYHLLAASLASCTALTLKSWAIPAGIQVHSLTISVVWDLVAARPKRVSRIEAVLHWPELPPSRVEAAERVAKLCPIHATLRAGANDVVTRVQRA